MFLDEFRIFDNKEILLKKKQYNKMIIHIYVYIIYIINTFHLYYKISKTSPWDALKINTF